MRRLRRGAGPPEPSRPPLYDELENATEDHRAAAEARRRYRLTGLPRLCPDLDLERVLEGDEIAVELHAACSLTLYRDGRPDGAVQGPLLLTTRRVLVSAAPVSGVELSAVRELEVTRRHLLIALADGSAATIETARPLLLRAQIAAVIAATRG